MALLDHLGPVLTLGLDTNKPNNREYGTFNPANTDDNYLGSRYGLSDRTAPTPGHPEGEELMNGEVYGPEGTGLEPLQLAISLGLLSGAPYDIPATAASTATMTDVVDCRFIADMDPNGPHADGKPTESIFGWTIRNGLQKWAAANPVPVPIQTPPNLGGHAPVTPVPATPAMPTPVVVNTPTTSPTPPAASAALPSQITDFLAALEASIAQIVPIVGDVAAIKTQVNSIIKGGGGQAAAAPPTSAPTSPGLIELSAQSAIVTQAAAGLQSLTQAGFANSGGGHWAILFRNLVYSIVNAKM